MIHITGYICAALIGISLGLIGGGGSILTVPVLVYLFGLSPLIATSYSLFIVGSTSFVGAFNNYRKGFVDLPTALLFGCSSITTVFITRKLIIPAIPHHIATIGSVEVSFSLLTMVLFAILMLMASYSMIRNRNETQLRALKSRSLLLVYGIAIGLVTGFLGAGGGFLLIPALVLFVGLPMKKAIGTSLLIIAMNSLIGFMGDVTHYTINWIFLFIVSAIAIAGIFIGGWLGRMVPGEKLKRGFGWFVLAMGFYIIARELFFR
jgi:hypothetical protein